MSGLRYDKLLLNSLCVFSYSSVNGTDLGPRSGSCSASNGVDGQVPSSSCSPALSHVVNGDSTQNSTPVHQPSDSDTESRTGELDLQFAFHSVSQVCMVCFLLQGYKTLQSPKMCIRIYIRICFSHSQTFFPCEWQRSWI